MILNLSPLMMPTKNFKVLEKYNMPIMRGMVIDNTEIPSQTPGHPFRIIKCPKVHMPPL